MPMKFGGTSYSKKRKLGKLLQNCGVRIKEDEGKICILALYIECYYTGTLLFYVQIGQQMGKKLFSTLVWNGSGQLIPFPFFSDFKKLLNDENSYFYRFLFLFLPNPSFQTHS